MKSIVSALFLLALLPQWAVASELSPFSVRGYYLTFMRMPTYGLSAWKTIVDDVRSDGGNMLVLWTAGAFRSEKFPVTWQYNADHENIRAEFLGELIDYAHSLNIRILLGFTPFGYDGTNQYPLLKPALRATGPDGKPAAAFGIGCWGYNLCPAAAESQQFMREYLLEMIDRYPQADGLLVESSDYAICHCNRCGPNYFNNEFQLVKTISESLWARKPNAEIYLYPHYFSGANVPGFGVKAAKLPFDSRWGLFFTPHSAHLDPALLKQARHSIYWDDSPALRSPAQVKEAALKAKAAGVTGYLPSLETFSFLSTHGEENSPWTKNRRQIPLGMGWLSSGQSPYRELPLRLQRMAYREFTQRPDLNLSDFISSAAREMLGPDATPQDAAALMDLQAIFAYKRTWCQPSPAVSRQRFDYLKSIGQLDRETVEQIEKYHQRLNKIALLEQTSKNAGKADLARISRWVLEQWKGSDPSSR
jgi:hypothetical protein